MNTQYLEGRAQYILLLGGGEGCTALALLMRRIWAFVRELSGEAALERRMAGQCACNPREAYEKAVAEQFGAGPHRCC